MYTYYKNRDTKYTELLVCLLTSALRNEIKLKLDLHITIK